MASRRGRTPNTTRRHQPPTAEQRAQWDSDRQTKLADLHKRITAEVSTLTQGEQWRQWLGFAANFHTYSFLNTLAIQMQRPDATWVAGFSQWKKMGRNVRKGEHGIAILAPITGRGDDADASQPSADGSDHADTTGWAAIGTQVATGQSVGKIADHGVRTATPAPRVLRGFTVVHVFDISQTDGDGVPLRPGRAAANVNLLAGQAPTGLWDALSHIATEQGYTVQRGACGGTRNGYIDFGTRVIRVRDDVDDAQAVKTMAHEVGHMLLHSPEEFGQSTSAGCRGRAEVEAESVAYLVAAHYGLDTSSYTFGYVANWAQRAAEKEKRSPEEIVQATGGRVVSTAFAITERADAYLKVGDPQPSPVLADRVIAGRESTSTLRATFEDQAYPDRPDTPAPPAKETASSASRTRVQTLGQMALPFPFFPDGELVPGEKPGEPVEPPRDPAARPLSAIPTEPVHGAERADGVLQSAEGTDRPPGDNRDQPDHKRPILADTISLKAWFAEQDDAVRRISDELTRWLYKQIADAATDPGAIRAARLTRISEFCEAFHRRLDQAIQAGWQERGLESVELFRRYAHDDQFADELRAVAGLTAYIAVRADPSGGFESVVPPDRQKVLIRAIEDHAARYVRPFSPIPGLDPVRYVAQGHVTGATSTEWDWIAYYIYTHPEILKRPPPSFAELDDRDRREWQHVRDEAVRLSGQARRAFDAGDYLTALTIIDQAAGLDSIARDWDAIRQQIHDARRQSESDRTAVQPEPPDHRHVEGTYHDGCPEATDTGRAELSLDADCTTTDRNRTASDPTPASRAFQHPPRSAVTTTPLAAPPSPLPNSALSPPNDPQSPSVASLRRSLHRSRNSSTGRRR